MLDANSVLEVLRPVQDPELQKSLVDLNMSFSSFQDYTTILPVRGGVECDRVSVYDREPTKASCRSIASESKALTSCSSV